MSINLAMDRRSLFVAMLIACVSIFGTANNFASRIKAVILGDSNFVCVVPDSLVQLTVNLLFLTVFTIRGKVPQSQFRYIFVCARSFAQNGAWKYLALAGSSDIANNVTGLAAQPYLTTFMMSLMDQATTPFTVVFSVLLLKIRYNCLEIVSVVVIIFAAVTCVLIAGAHGGEGSSQFWAFFAAITTSFAALSFVLKEIVFTGFRNSQNGDLHTALRIQLQQPPFSDANSEQLQRRLNEGGLLEAAGPDIPDIVAPDNLNVFLVGSVINFVGLLSSVPIALLNHAAVSSGPSMPALVDGLRLLFEKEHAMTAYVVYICINTIFNLSLILTTSYGSALLSFLSLKAAVPLTAILSAVPWPVIGPKPLNAADWLALLVLIAGIVAFRVGNLQREKHA
ncbi:unnamed protein product [Effrenium voratum]|uniref:Uncharacterized protein n=1 Tax=Effrenium voratum TaxID=2562239 RepID=A0AA36HK97_9DINO|nr:unnamed protein product [Effrenium voratum]CAJ1370662.1 unnamed protein product [Effrenium voratum]